MYKNYDCVIIGAGIYGLYSAKLLSERYPNSKIIIIEYEKTPFSRASYINQARVHNGYHYPRSLWTALKSAGYYKRFNDDFSFAINKKFKKIYAISKDFTYATRDNFIDFCNAANIKCDEIHPNAYFRDSMTQGAFIADEYAFDAFKILDYFLDYLKTAENVSIVTSDNIVDVSKPDTKWKLKLKSGMLINSPFILNATYASSNQVNELFNLDLLPIKYEIAELCICDVSDNLKDAGITVMDGPFFSVMPFGLNGKFSLSSVHFTPHKSSYEKLPTFNCQNNNLLCSPYQLENCNECITKPKSAFQNMHQLAKKYLNEDIGIKYDRSLFAIKPILKSAEVSDARPTKIIELSSKPRFISVLSGKINTIYDLDEVLYL